MFKTKTTADAIAPFRKVVKNLKQVIGAQDAAVKAAEAELAAAATEFNRVQSVKTIARTSAQVEKERAAKLLGKLEALLSDD